MRRIDGSESRDPHANAPNAEVVLRSNEGLDRLSGRTHRRMPGTTLPELLLAGTTLALLYLVLEFWIFPLALPHVPLALQPYLPAEIRLFAQSSKSALIPRDYVAITGDSYAQGLGDWLLSADPRRNDAFHSAHVLHEQTGRDVLTLGGGGAGSYGGALLRPVRHLQRRGGRFEIEAPSALVVYDYEGNDLFDSLLELYLLSGPVRRGARQVPAGDPAPRILGEIGSRVAPMQDAKQLRSVLEAGLERQAPPTPERFGIDSLYFARSLGSLVRGRGQQQFPHWSEPGRGFERWEGIEGEPEVRIAGRERKIPSRLQGPPLRRLLPKLPNGSLFEIGVLVFSESLRILSERVPAESEICVVYIASPLSLYNRVRLTDRRGTRAPSIAPAEIERAHRELRDRIRSVAERERLRFVDTTPALRQSASQQLLHGPRDWNHFNRAGHELLGREAARCL